MKIVFDSEEQKKYFFDNICGCPQTVGLNNISPEDCWLGELPERCAECWVQSGIEIEVKPNGQG